MTTSSALLQLQTATLRLPGRHFGPFDLQLHAGERVAILGPSGAGKSTLLKLLCGDLFALDGQVLWRGQALASMPARALARQRAVLPQSHGVAFGMPVELVVALGRMAHEPERGQAAIVAGALQAACAAHLAGRRFDTLSGGEQARVQLARVMAQLWDAQQGLLLVDEPLAALDPGLQFELMDALQHYASSRGHALVAVLHDINQALAGFDRLWLVQSGQVLADLPAGRRALPALEDLFGIELHAVDMGAGRVAVLAQRGKPLVTQSAQITQAAQAATEPQTKQAAQAATEPQTSSAGSAGSAKGGIDARQLSPTNLARHHRQQHLDLPRPAAGGRLAGKPGALGSAQ